MPKRAKGSSLRTWKWLISRDLDGSQQDISGEAMAVNPARGAGGFATSKVSAFIVISGYPAVNLGVPKYSGRDSAFENP
jgi:hypothetical protein